MLNTKPTLQPITEERVVELFTDEPLEVIEAEAYGCEDFYIEPNYPEKPMLVAYLWSRTPEDAKRAVWDAEAGEWVFGD